MCTVTCDGSCNASSSTFLSDAAIALVKGAWWTLTRVAAPAVAAVAVWIAGVAVTPTGRRDRGLSKATWLRSGQKVGNTRLRIHWYAWPGWQRTLVRAGAVALVVAAVWAPLVTAVAVVSVVAAVTGVAVWRRQPPKPIKAVVGKPRPRLEPAPEQTGTEWEWDPTEAKVTVR